QRSGNNPNAILEICRDITAQLQAEEALRNADKLAARGLIAEIVAHEINNPLGAITNVFYLLRNHPSLDPEARNYARMAEQELERIAHITRQTLSFYRETSHPVPVSTTSLLDEILELHTSQLERNNIKIDRRYSNEGIVQGFPGELKQVLLNLVSNAIEAMPEGGRLRVHVGESFGANVDHGRIRISIVDTGSGIAPEDAKRLFEPFFSTKASKGTGLGLWISKGILQKYEGTIRFRSIGLRSRKVTCFSIFIPSSPQPHQLQPAAVMRVVEAEAGTIY